MAVLQTLLGTKDEKYEDVLDTLNDALSRLRAAEAEITVLQGGTPTPSPSPAPSPSPSPSPSPTPPPAGTVVFPASGQSGTTSDTGFVNVGSADMAMVHPYKNGVTGGVYLFGMSTAGDGLAFIQQNDQNYKVKPVAGFDYGDPLSNSGAIASLTINVADGAQFRPSLDNGLFELLVDGVQQPFGGIPSGKLDVSEYVKGTGAQYKVHVGAAIVGLKIIAQ